MLALVLILAGQWGVAGCASGRTIYTPPAYAPQPAPTTLPAPAVESPRVIDQPPVDVEKLKAELRLELRAYAREWLEKKLAEQQQSSNAEQITMLHMPREMPDEELDAIPVMPSITPQPATKIAPPIPLLPYVLFACAAIMLLLDLKRSEHA